ncbi:MAG: amidohydrolase family protein [Candidatus Kapaibacteriales bacterium]
MERNSFQCKILNPREDGSVDFLPSGYLEFDQNGIITQFGTKKINNKSRSNEESENYLLIPGLIDLHSHIPQLPGIAKNADELIPWLKNHIFPLEVRFQNLNYAEIVAKVFFKQALRFGTTCIVAYSSVSKEATNTAFEVAKSIGIRAFIGKIMMDNDMGKYPANLPKWKDNIKDSLDLAKKWHNSNNGLLKYIFTPRFAASCSMKLLEKTAEVANSDGFYIQTHLAENRSEINYIKSLFPKVVSNTHIFKKSNLLTERTLLAHCLHLSQIELKIIKEANSKIVHCPTSNIFLQSGFMPYRRYKNHQIQVGLGTDIAGGYSLSLFNEMRNAIESSKIVNYLNSTHNNSILSGIEIFWDSTLGAAKILNLDKFIGNFEVGKEADFILIKLNPEFKFYLLNEDAENILMNLIYLPHTYLIEKVYVRGKELDLSFDFEIPKPSSQISYT